MLSYGENPESVAPGLIQYRVVMYGQNYDS